MGFEEDFKRIVKEAASTKFDGDTDLAKKAQVPQSAVSMLNSGTRKGLQLATVGKLLDAIGARIVVGDTGGSEAPDRRLRELENKVKELQTLLDSREEVIRLQKELMATLKSATPIKRAPKTGHGEWANQSNGDSKTPEPNDQEDRPPAG